MVRPDKPDSIRVEQPHLGLSGKRPGKVRRTGAKHAFVRSIKVRLAEKKVALNYIKRKIKLASQSGRIAVSPQLLRAECQADSCEADLRQQLEQLEMADDDSWDLQRSRVELAWEELSQSIRKIVARFP